MTTSIFIEDSFDSAHWLPNVPEGHKCRHMHGHTYRIRIEYDGEVGKETGWIVDYAEVKADWDHVKLFFLDHKVINDVIPNSTCELLARWIFGELNRQPSRIELRETERCGAIVVR